jgi:hypothetical protein
MGDIVGKFSGLEWKSVTATGNWERYKYGLAEGGISVELEARRRRKQVRSCILRDIPGTSPMLL